jgi:predicted secreted protein
MLSDGFATFKEVNDTQNTGRKDIQVDNFYAKNGYWAKMNKIIEDMKLRKTEKNIASVKEYVAGLQTN